MLSLSIAVTLRFFTKHLVYSKPAAGTTEIDAALMPDLLHPSVAGMAKLADCLLAKSRFLTR